MKYIIVLMSLFVSAQAFAVNPGFLSGVVNVSSSNVYTVNRSTDTTIKNVKTDSSDLLILLPASPSIGDTYLVKDVTGTCDQDGFLDHAFCIESVGHGVSIDGSNEECLVACGEGAIYQYNGTGYVDIGDNF